MEAEALTGGGRGCCCLALTFASASPRHYCCSRVYPAVLCSALPTWCFSALQDKGNPAPVELIVFLRERFNCVYCTDSRCAIRAAVWLALVGMYLDKGYFFVFLPQEMVK